MPTVFLEGSGGGSQPVREMRWCSIRVVVQSVRGMGREKEEWLHEIQGGELAFTYLLSLSLLLPLPQGWGLQRLVLPAL